MVSSEGDEGGGKENYEQHFTDTFILSWGGRGGHSEQLWAL